jgi:hypothetical protein
MTAELTTPPECRNCHKPRRPRANQPGYKGANGYCESCNNRWHAAGCPPEGPPPPMTAAERTARANEIKHAARQPVTLRRFPAACAGMPLELFWPPEGGDGSAEAKAEREAQAKAVCAGCAGRRDCLDEALRLHDWEDGIRGGMDGRERKAEHTKRLRLGREVAA